MFGLRTRLFLVSLILVGAFAATSGLWFAGRMRAVLTDHVEQNLHAHAQTLFQTIPAGASDLDLISITDRVQNATQARVTIIAPDGRVIADSDVADERTMDNHGGRPEVVDALGPARYGMSRRYSETAKRDVMYVAVPWARNAEMGVIRVARPMEDVEAQVQDLRTPMWIAALGGMVLMIVLSWGFSELVTRDFRALTARARALARSDEDSGTNEVAWIAGSMDRMGEELRQAVDEVADERNRLQAVIVGMREAVIALDPEGRVHTTNPSARALFHREEVQTGTPIDEVVDNQALLDLVQRSLDSELPGAAELPWPDADGAPTRHLVVTATPQVGGGAVVVLHDTTELRRLEAVRRDFVANVSHELRTPVAAVISSAEALLDGAAGDPVHGPRFAQAVARNAERLRALVTDLLDLAKIEGGDQVLDMRPVPVRVVVAGALELLQEKATERGQQINVDVADDLVVSADAVALQQVLVNLIDNAIKYTPEGGGITVEAKAWAGSVQIDVADDGPGIGAVHRKRLFERFYRVDPGRSRDMGGTGLGLSIVRHLVQLMGGSVAVLSNAPQGTRFRVMLRM